MERADESLLPGVYKEVGAALHTDPTGLGSLTLFRSIVQSLCYPLAMYLSVRHDRTHVIALGAFLWAAATFLVGFSSTFFQVAVSRGLNGIGLAMVTPSIQSLVADSTEYHNRGVAFGWLGLTGNIGSILGGLLSILLASTSFMGIAGWRISFHLVAIVSIIVGILVRLYVKDPMFVEKNSLKEFLEEAKSVMKIPSFQISMVGFSVRTNVVRTYCLHPQRNSFPLEYVSSCLFYWGTFWWEDGRHTLYPSPNSGRIILSQRSAGSFIPLAWILMFGLPDDPSTALKHGLALFIMGLFTSWNIVPKKSRTSIYALDLSFESVLASFAPPIVGLLSQHVFGYTPAPHGSSQSVELETDRKNAASLAKAALYTLVAIPMVICVLMYSFLYCTYPRGRDRAKMKALIESEMELLEAENLPREGKYSHTSEVYEKETVIELDYKVTDSLEVDDSDEKTLLTHEQL
ncbi:hypothetical protein MKX03_009339 [Papaver bracteatum]|nr:hypothetical protein MKX03_009339 [Papaver bracteatum]